ncbi:MAG: hypothetical protein HY725_11780 [Candidatus Rokubacteria bacterium]|nr:hypothetical protein [Candidatus Rokubacteria bacterium]
MAKRLSTEVHDVVNVGEDAGVAVRLPDPPAGSAPAIPAWEDRVEPHEREEMDPRAIPAWEDEPPRRLSGRDQR